MTASLPDDVTPWEPKPDPDDSRAVPRTTKVCVATATNGFRCTRKSIPGGNVCERHGGGSERVQRAGQLRLAALFEPVVATLAREMTTADKSADRIRAAEILFKRLAPEKVSVESHDAKEALRQRLYAIKQDAEDPPVITDLPNPPTPKDDR